MTTIARCEYRRHRTTGSLYAVGWTRGGAFVCAGPISKEEAERPPIVHLRGPNTAPPTVDPADLHAADGTFWIRQG